MEGVSARQLLKIDNSAEYRHIPTFVQALDEKLGGGIKPGSVTEIVGDSGLGKTTFCLQLCLTVQVPASIQGLAGEALYIDMHNTIDKQRLSDMARAFAHHCNGITSETRDNRRISERDVMSRVHVVKCKELQKLVTIMLSLEDYIARNRKIRLLVLDSIAYPFYAEDDGFQERTQSLYNIGQRLHHLAGKYGIAIVLTNNLTTRFHQQNGKEYFVPFLGDAWFHVPNQRIHLYWNKRQKSRVAEIVKSPCAATASVRYRVTGAGIRE